MIDENTEDLEAEQEDAPSEEPWPQWPVQKKKSLYEQLSHPADE